mgnify:FL=1
MIKASATITLATATSVESVWKYYILQEAALGAPSIDDQTVRPPKTGGVEWTLTEPSYTAGSTDKLYFVDCTVFNDDTMVYSQVSLSSSYEAAKQAYSEAQVAQGMIEATQRHFWTDESGAHVTKKPRSDFLANPEFLNVLATNSDFRIKMGGALLSKYDSNGMYFLDPTDNKEVAKFTRTESIVGKTENNPHIRLSSSYLKIRDEFANDRFVIEKQPGGGLTEAFISTWPVNIIPGSSYVWFGELYFDVTIDVPLTITSLKIYRVEDEYEPPYGNKYEQFLCPVSKITRQEGKRIYFDPTGENWYLTQNPDTFYPYYYIVAAVTYTVADKATYNIKFGYGNSTTGDNSVVLGRGIQTAGDAQLAFGRYNLPDTNSEFALVAGGGYNPSDRSNILTVSWDGRLNSYWKMSNPFKLKNIKEGTYVGVHNQPFNAKKLVNLETKNHNGDTTLGYGNFFDRSGDTNIYGYDINVNPIGSCTVPIKDNIIIRSITSASFNLNANAYTNISKDSESIIKFSPVGIVGYNLDGSGTSKVSIPKVYLDGTTCRAGVRNQGSSQTGWTFTWYVMYVRTRGLYSPKNP